MELYQVIESAYGEQIRSLSSRLHRRPELSFREYETTALLKRLLTEKGLSLLPLDLETGVAALLRGGDGPRIALRADIDAIAQHELSERSDRSEVEGVMHGCGHDTHTAGLYGAACYLADHRELLRGDVLFIFQPAEETLKGARYMIEHGLWDAFRPDMLFGLHNLPSIPVGRVGIKAGPLMSFKDGFRIRYIGKSGHTSTPQKNVDPIVAMAQLIVALQSVVSRNVGPLESAVLTVCSVEAGSPFTTTIDDAVITGNIRSLDPSVRRRVLERVKRLAVDIASAFECRAEIEELPLTDGVINSRELLPIAEEAGNLVFGKDGVVVPDVNLASEDFAILGRDIPSFFYFLGSGVPGETPFLWHNPRFHAAQQTPVYGAALLAATVLAAQGS